MFIQGRYPIYIPLYPLRYPDLISTLISVFFILILILIYPILSELYISLDIQFYIQDQYLFFSVFIQLYPKNISQKYILYVIPVLIRKYPYWGTLPGGPGPAPAAGGHSTVGSGWPGQWKRLAPAKDRSISFDLYPFASRWWLAHVSPSQLFDCISSGRHKFT